MPTSVDNFQNILGVHSLDLFNNNNSNIATFSSGTNSSLISFYTNLDNNNYISTGTSNSTFIIRESNNTNGFIYNNNTINIDNINSYNVKLDNINNNTSLLVFPNNETYISSYIFTSSGSTGFNYPSKLFDMDITTYWKSESNFSFSGNLTTGSSYIDNIYIEQDSINTKESGEWVTIKLPYSIILTRYHIAAVNGYEQYAPTHFILYGYDYVLLKWRLISEQSYYNYSINDNIYIDIDSNKQHLYDTFTLLVSQVNGGTCVQISLLEFFAKPIITINDTLKICDNNIYNINTLVAKELRLNNDSITTFSNLIKDITNGVVSIINSNISLYWIGTLNSNIYCKKNVGIFDKNPNSALSINGDISYNRRIIENSLSIYPHSELIINGASIPIQRYVYSYITIGTLVFSTNDYFHINIYSIDIPINSSDYMYKSYSQKLSVYGICNPLTNSIYYNDDIDISYLPIDPGYGVKLERITNISYNYINNNTLELYVKYNDLLNITSTVSPKNFSNILYVDFVNTRTNINNNFILNTKINYPSTGSVPINAIKNISHVIDINSINSNIYKNYCTSYSDSITTNAIYFTNNNYIANNILYTDTNGYIKSSSITKNYLEKIYSLNNSSNSILYINNQGIISSCYVTSTFLDNLSKLSNSSNNVIITNYKGDLIPSVTTKNQLEGLNNISYSSNKVIITNNTGILSYCDVTIEQLMGLSNISITSNKVVLTNSNGILTSANVTETQLNALYTISSSRNKVLITDNNGIINYTPVTNDMLMGLYNITTKPQRMVVTDDKGILSTTNIILGDIENLNNTLSLFYNNNADAYYTYYNIVIGSNANIGNSQLYVKGKITTDNIKINSVLSLENGAIFWNSNLNALQYNNTSQNNLYNNNSKLFSDDIFRYVAKYPPTFLNTTLFNNNIPRNQHIFSLQLNSISSYGNGLYTLKVDSQDDGINYNNIDKIFSDNSLNYYWRSYTNFDTSIIGYSTTKYVESNLTKYFNTNCGSYFIITIPDQILLTYYNIYYNYSNGYNYYNTLNTFTLFGYNSTNDNWDTIDIQTNIKTWKNNFIPNTFSIQNVYNNLRYNTFCICIYKTNTNTATNFAVINGFELYGINNYFGNIIYNLPNTSSITYNINNNSNIYNKAFQSSPSFIIGNINVGINNLNPSTLLSIGNDIYTNNNIINSESILNLNHGINIDGLNNVGVRLLNLTRPSNNSTHGIRASHILNTWVNNIDDVRTRYDINLSHKNYENENTVLSMLSDGRVGIGMVPDTSNYRQPNLSILSNIYLYNTKNANDNYNANFISIGVNNINSNYGIILPQSIGSINSFLNITNLYNNQVKEGNRIISAGLDWTQPNDIFKNITFAKIGNQSTISCNIGSVKLQVAGSCIIGANLIDKLPSSYVNQNTLVVNGNIYTTQDITTDSDISYKYNFKKIDNAIDKINNLHGYTFNRNDTTDDDINKRYCGLIAQDVQKVLPEAIIKKHDNKLRVIYNNLAALFVEGFKEHDKNIICMNYKINILFILFIIHILYNVIMT